MIQIVYVIVITATLVGCNRSNAAIIDGTELSVVQKQERNGASWTLDDSPKKIAETDQIILYKRVQMNIFTSGSTTSYYIYEKDGADKAK